MNEIISLCLGVLSYFFIIMFVFYTLKVDYYNPVVKAFVNFYSPISKISIFSNQVYTIFLLAVLLKFSGYYLLYSLSSLCQLCQVDKRSASFPPRGDSPPVHPVLPLRTKERDVSLRRSPWRKCEQ